MAFTRTNLSGNVGTGSNAPTLFTYSTTVDNKAAVIAAGYFLGATDMLSVGDIIIAKATDATVMLVVLTSTASALTTGYVAVA
jgi:hypothetical protein